MPKKLLFFIFVFSCSRIERLPPPPRSYSASSFHLEVHKETLKNGLRVLIFENPHLPLLSYYTFFDVGGRYENPGTTGSTHFLEHMLFEGTKKFPRGTFDRLIEGEGGSSNAYTSFDATVYFNRIPSHLLEKVIELEADRVQNLLLHPKAFESERKVVLEERKMRYENSARGKLYLKMMQAVFEKTPYGGSVIGSLKDVKALRRDDLAHFFKSFYTPDNAVIVVAGQVDSSQVLSLIRKHYGKWAPASPSLKAFKAKKNEVVRYRHQGRYGRHIKLKGVAPNPLFRMAYKGVRLGEREGYALDLLSQIIGEGKSSFLNQVYVKGKRPRLSKAHSYNLTMAFNGVFWVGGTLLPKVGLKKTLKKIERDLLKACETRVNKRSLKKAKNQYLVDYFSGIQTNSGVAHMIGNYELFYNDYSHYKKDIEIYNSLSLSEVRTSCQRIFSKSPLALSIWKHHRKK